MQNKAHTTDTSFPGIVVVSLKSLNVRELEMANLGPAPGPKRADTGLMIFFI